ncbi:cobalamin-binding protein [Egbenema bharatensis]|uniref:cobalamin-binding protein n=1 Tax=Egbenema bharatensis TaxID=3463334 RepID=UPI003A8433AA
MTQNQTADLRILSLIPSATEIVDCLGLVERLVGRSHECDYPVSVQSLPVCTAPKFNPEGTSAEIHDRVTELLQTALSVYQIQTDVLEQLRPTHILTQAQCEVCAVSLSDVEQAVDQLTQTHPKIISLQPNTLAEVWQDIRRVGQTLGVATDEPIARLQQRVECCTQITEKIPVADRPTVACIEWADPLMAAGNWIPELVQRAGGKSLFGTIGQHSPWLQWEELVAVDPELIILMPCGFGLDRTQEDLELLAQQPQWSSLSAVKTGQVYITDGNHYFNRPGPRLVDSLEILAEIFHPDRFHYGYQGQGWQKLQSLRDK